MKIPIQKGVELCRHNLLIPVTCTYAAGVAAALQTELPCSIVTLSALTLIPFSAGLFAYALACMRISLILLMAAFAALGYTMTEVRERQPQQKDSLAAQIHEKTQVTLIGTVMSMVTFDGEKSRLVLAVEQMLDHTQEQPKKFTAIKGKVRLSIRGQLGPEIQAGTPLMTVATLSPVRPAQTPGTFDYARYLAEKNIYITGWISETTFIERLQPADISLLHRLKYVPEQLRQRFAIFFSSNLSPESAGLYQALLLGSRANIPLETLEKFKTGGVLHLLAISGLHLGLLAAGMAALTLFCLKRSKWLLLHTHVQSLALALTLPALLTYSLVAGMNLPVFRALIMAMLAGYAVLIKRFALPVHLIAAAALLVLLVSPLALGTASFQLSFTAVLGIVVTAGKIGRKWLDIKKNKPVIGYLLFPVTALLVSICATLATLPIMLVHFGRVSLIGPVVNLLVEPLLCFWALPLGLLSLPLSCVAPKAALWLLHLGEAGFHISDYILTIGSHIPAASIWTISPAWWEIFLYYGLLTLPLIRSLSRAVPVVCLSAGIPFLLLSFTYTLWHTPSRSETMVHFIDVGQGSSTLLELRDGANLLIDGGGRDSARYNVGEGIIAPFLRSRRIWKIDAVIISHPHSDHYNGIPFLLEQYAPRRLYINGQKTREWRYLKLLADAKKREVQIHALQKDHIVHQSADDTLECLGTPGMEGIESLSTNDKSLVLRLRSGASQSILLPGDITGSAEELFSGGTLSKVTVLVAPHHGSTTSTTPAFLQAVDPEFIVVSSGYARRGKLPAPSHVAKWKQLTIPFSTTALSGTMRCTINGRHLQLQDYKGNILLRK